MTRTAIVVAGDYSPVFSRNKFPQNTDIFYLSFTPLPANMKPRGENIYYPQNVKEIIPDYSLFHISHRALASFEYLFNKGLERVSGVGGYDAIIFTTFRHIFLDDIPLHGIYYTWVAHGLFGNRIYIRAVEVMSNSMVRLNGSPQCSPYDLPPSDRKKFFDIYFSKRVCELVELNFDNELVVAIPSVIQVSANKFDYIDYRSIFTVDDRFNQTIAQLESIQNTVLFEGSRLDLNYLDALSQKSRVVICCTDPVADRYANSHSNKGIYECYIMKKVLEKCVDTKWVVKFGGRYKTLPQFDIEQLKNDKITINKIEASNTFTNQPIVQTVMYSIPQRLMENFKTIFDELIVMFESGKQTTGIEGELFVKIINLGEHNIKWMKYFNVMGYDAIEGKLNYI